MTSRFLFIGNESGSAVNFKLDLFSALIASGSSVALLLPMCTETDRTRLESEGVKVIDFGINKKGRLNLFSEIKFFLSIRRYLKLSCGATIVPFFLRNCVLASLASFGAQPKPKIISYIEGFGSLGTYPLSVFRYISLCIVTRIIATYSSSVVVLNPDNELFFAKISRNKLINIDGIGFDASKFFPPSDPRLHLRSVMMASRLFDEKGVSLYLDLAESFCGMGPKFKLVGSVDPGLSAQTKSRLDRLIAAGYVEYLGYCSDMPSLFKDADLVVLPSYYGEGRPRSLMEALGSGIPVITLNVPGCRDLVVHNQGGLIAPIESFVFTSHRWICDLIGSPEDYQFQSQAAYLSSFRFRNEVSIPRQLNILQGLHVDS